MAHRLEGLDLARFLAFAGMVLVNFDIVLRQPNLSEPWLIDLAQGRAAALFVVLAGIGFALGSGSKSFPLDPESVSKDGPGTAVPAPCPSLS